MKITDLPQMVAAFHSLVRCCMAPVRLQRVVCFPTAGQPRQCTCWHVPAIAIAALDFSSRCRVRF